MGQVESAAMHTDLQQVLNLSVVEELVSIGEKVRAEHLRSRSAELVNIAHLDPMALKPAAGVARVHTDLSAQELGVDIAHTDQTC